MGLILFDQLTVGPLGCNCYIVGDPSTMQAVVVDPGGDPDAILASLEAKGLQLISMVATHAHFDHILAADALRERTGAQFCLGKEDLYLLPWVAISLEMFLGLPPVDAPEVDRQLIDGDELSVGEGALKVLHTPGHSAGSISLLSDPGVFGGDILFAGSIGRTDLPGGDHGQEIASIRERLLPLGDLPLYPGHGPSTTLDRERATNPFLQ